MSDVKKKILIHACCAPDVTVVIERLSKDYDITIYFYDPNIHPKSEYDLREQEMVRVGKNMNVPVMCGEYDDERWFFLVRGLEQEPEKGKRCDVCFEMRLRSTARMARLNGFDMFGTVLTVSPHKNASLINELGKKIGDEYGVDFLEADFKKQDGFKRSLKLSEQQNLFRQDYCGCIFSKEERERNKRKKSREEK